MRLSEWLKKCDLKQADFAKIVGVVPPTISRIIKGSRQPSSALIAEIERATKGKVTWEDWRKSRRDLPESQ